MDFGSIVHLQFDALDSTPKCRKLYQKRLSNDVILFSGRGKGSNMNNFRRRFIVYALLGLVFGVLDWFYLDWLAHFDWGSLGQSILVIPVIIFMNFGIWLVPLLPVVLYEARFAQKATGPMLAGMLTWSCAIFSYYFYYAVLLSLGKLPHLEHLNVFGEKYERFWYEYWQMFKGIILGQFFEWIVIALIGGALIGALAYWVVRKRNRTRQAQEPGQP
jgi:hypothetical protein